MKMKNLLQNCFIKEGTFKSEVLNGTKLKIKQLTVKEQFEYEKINRENPTDYNVAVKYAVKCSMVEPSFFTDDELEKINKVGFDLINEVFGEIPLIGKSLKERKEYFEMLDEYFKNVETENKTKSQKNMPN